jgi:hypothetical protein
VGQPPETDGPSLDRPWPGNPAENLFLFVEAAFLPAVHPRRSFSGKYLKQLRFQKLVLWARHLLLTYRHAGKGLHRHGARASPAAALKQTEKESESMRRLGMLLLGACLLAMPSAALASAMYSYTGPNFGFIIDNNPPAGTFTNTMNVSGSFTIAAALSAGMGIGDISGSILSYSFFDGRTLFTDANSSITLFSVGTDAGAAIDDWQISFSRGTAINVFDQEQALGTQTANDFGNVSECNVVGCGGFIADNAITFSSGVWTFVPEPSTGLLVAMGLAGIAARRRWAVA